MKEQNAGTDSSATEHTALAHSPEVNDSSHLDGMGAVEPSKTGPKEATWKDGRSPDPSRMCTARRTNGEPCRRIAILGGTTCPAHGGSAPQVKAAARVRIERAADRMAKELLGMAVADDVSDAVKLSAIKDALDRAGLGSKHAVEVEVGPTPAWKTVIETAMGAGSRAESRAARGIPNDGAAVIDAEIVDEDEAMDLLDGVGDGTTPPVPNAAVAQPDLDTTSHRRGGSTGTGSGTNPNGNGQRATDDLRGSRIQSKIISLEVAHPEDNPPRRIRTNERNRAITPKMTNTRKKRRSE